ncbi:MAG: Maf family protein [Treponema sp.]|nr:Maf family protein [Treponema sp.]
MEPIVLASGSLRRQEYFRLLGLPFSIMPSLIDESFDVNANPNDVAKEMAKRKVQKIIDLFKGHTSPWICGADTVVFVDGKIFGKPKNRDNAKHMLTIIQGRDHEVITAVALYNGKEKVMDIRTVCSTVTFTPLSDEDMEWYLDTGEWQGSAGAYRIQGMAGCLISGIKGSYSGIVGLPLHEFYVMLKDNGYSYTG